MMPGGGLPNFFVIGAPKAGTTSLYNYLRQHPEVFMSDVKEPAFFSSDDNYRKGIGWYRDNFFRGGNGSTAMGEATPWYFPNAKVVDRIAHDLPPSSWRFILILRDPVARAYSMYWNLVRAGVESKSFEDALRLEDERMADPALHHRGSLTVGYRYVGNYASRLTAWIERFRQDRLFVLLDEDLRERPAVTMSEIFEFLGVAADVRIDTTVAHNPSSTVRYPRLRNAWRAWRRMPRWTRAPLNVLPDRVKLRLFQTLAVANRKPWRYPPMSPETERQLRKEFHGGIVKLEELLGRDLSTWKASSPGERAATDG